jgi:outer membrane protein OmpA-like peptidoglycan-associated protein
MRNTTTVITIAAILMLLVAQPASANSGSSREEAVGVGSGAIIGAVAGGPIGFVVGAAIGAKIGDTMHQKNERMDELSGSLEDSRRTVATLEGDLGTLGSEIERLQTLARPELVNLLQAGIAMDLLFRTDEFALADTTGDRLASLAGSLASMRDVRIQLDGYADERGDEQYNAELSAKRVEFVRDLFVQAGVRPDRINAAAHGEAVAQDANIDSLALERRVSVTLFIDDAQPVASNPD